MFAALWVVWPTTNFGLFQNVPLKSLAGSLFYFQLYPLFFNLITYMLLSHFLLTLFILFWLVPRSHDYSSSRIYCAPAQPTNQIYPFIEKEMSKEPKVPKFYRRAYNSKKKKQRKGLYSQWRFLFVDMGLEQLVILLSLNLN